MSESASYPKAEFFRKPILSEYEYVLNTYSAQTVWQINPQKIMKILRISFRQSFLQVTIYWSLRKIYFEKYFVYLVITNVMMKTCLNQKIMKISNFIQAVGKYSDKIGFRKNISFPFGHIRKRKLSEGRIFPKADFVRIFTECTEVCIEHTTWQSRSET